jgi:hypothetical protein
MTAQRKKSPLVRDLSALPGGRMTSRRKSTIFDSDIATLDKAVLEADLKCSEALPCQPKG